MDIAAWQFIGAALVIWIIYDLIAGYTYLHRKIQRKQEPLFYWIVLATWMAVALYTLGLI